MRDIIPKFIGIPEADADREGWERFPILPSVIQVLPGIPSILLYPFGMEFSFFFFFLGNSRGSTQNPSWGQFGFILISHPFFFSLGLLPEFQTNPRGRIPGLRRILWGIFLGKL